jgi:pseudouridine kinase
MIERKSGKVAVIGGMNMDIGGSAAGKLRLRDSNPGLVSLRPGGVGRNIAHNLRLLGLEVSLVSALGDDPFGRALLESCQALGLELSMTQVRPRERSSTYLYVDDDGGDMLAAISDMEIIDRLSPAYLEPLLPRLNGFDALVVDANLSQASLRFLAERATVPLYADPVSVAKAGKLLPILPRLAALKPNRLEAEALTGETDPERALRALLAAGIKRVYLSLGGDGALAGEGETLLRLPRREVQVVSTTGAGDAVTAALVWAGVRGLDLERSARFAQMAGAMTCECREANNPKLGEIAEQFGMRSSESGIDP